MALTPKRLETMAGITVHTFADETFVKEAKVRVGNIRGRTRSVSTNALGRAGRGPAWGGRSWSADALLVDYFIDTAVVSQHEADLQKLEAIFPQDDDDTRDLGKLWFVIDEEGVEKRALVSMERLLPSDQSDHPQRLAHFIGQFTLLDARWHRATAESVTAVAKTTSPATLSITGGEAKSEEIVYTLKPTAAKTAANGQRFRYPISIKWTNPWPAHRLPVAITGSGWNHAAEVTATRSQADGDDVETRVGGKRVSRWSENWNNAATKVWIVGDFPAARYWTVRTGTTFGVSDTTFYAAEALTNIDPFPLYAWIDSEVVLVTGYDASLRTFTVSSTRGRRGTAAGSHSAGAKLYWLPPAQMVDLVYGGTSLSAPDYIDDATKPMIDMAASTNTSFVWASFQETLASGRTQARKPRAASWYTLDVVDRGKDHLYGEYVPYTTGINPTGDAATATEMGIGYRAAGGYDGHPLQTAWGMRLDVSITSIQYTYYVSVEWPAGRREARLHVVAIDTDGNRTVLRTLNSTGIPISGTPTDTITAGAREIRYELELYDWQPQQPSDGDGFDIDAFTATLSSSEAVAILFGSARQDIYEFGRPGAPATLANADSKTLGLNLVVALNETVSIDIDARAITISGDNTHQAHIATGDWPYLPAGTNNITFTEAGIGTVEVGVSSYRKAWA